MSHPPRTVSMESVGDDYARTPSWAVGREESTEDRTRSRRRSLECTGLDVRIVSAEITQDHTNYVITVSSGIRSWTIKRRYKDFYYLDKQLRKHHPMLQFPSLPPKRYLRSSNDPQTVDQRKQQLEHYLASVVQMQHVWTRNELALFLNDESNLMSYIWNFERMRRLQDMLSMMKIENQTEKEKLNLDLQKAQSQVSELQARLSQMEMIFLQQATGVGGQLPASVVRSISGVTRNALSSRLAKELKSEHKSLYDYEASSLDDVTLADVSAREAAANNNNSNSSPNNNNRLNDAGLYVGGQLVEEMHPNELVEALELAQRGERLDGGARMLSAKTPEQARTYAVSREIQEAIALCNEMLVADESAQQEVLQLQLRRSNLSETDRTSRLSGHSARFSVSSSEFLVDSFLQIEDALPADGVGVSATATAPWVSPLIAQVDKVVHALTPTEESLRTRQAIFFHVRDLVSDTLGVQLFPVGSFVSRTFLPDGDMDATAFVPRLSDDSWYVKLNETLCLSAATGVSMAVSNVSFVSGDSKMKMIRSLINNVCVDLSTNQLSSLYAEELIERVDAAVAQNHLFKRSLLLLKAWFQYESARFTHGGGSLCGGARDSKVSTWAIVVMLIWIFNAKGARIHHPLQALAQFFRIFSTFDWTNCALTVTGPVDFALNPVSVKSEDGEEGAASLFFAPEIFDVIEKPQEFQRPPRSVAAEEETTNDSKDSEVVISEGIAASEANVEDSAAEPSAVSAPEEAISPVVAATAVAAEPEPFQPHILNVLDPFVPRKNLLDAVTPAGFESIVVALQEGYRSYQQLCDDCARLSQCTSEELERLTGQFFLNTKAYLIPSPEEESDDAENKKETKDIDVFAIPHKDLKFSIGYGQLAVGGKIEQEVLIKLITIILEKKGNMPVGEIGKNLQSLLGCESLSKRLKEQYCGLKRSIENSNNPRIKMGAEHPFNPVVTLLESDPSEGKPAPPGPLDFDHESFLFIPFSVQARLQAQALKEAQSHNKTTRSYRRQAPQIPDHFSGYENAHFRKQGGHPGGYYRGKNPYGFPQNSPGRGGPQGGGFFPVGPQPIPIPHGMPPVNAQGQPMFPMPFVPMSPPTGPNGAPLFPYPGMPMFPGPHMMPYPPHMMPYPPSVSSSISSSFGQNSPLSLSPLGMSFMPVPSAANESPRDNKIGMFK